MSTIAEPLHVARFSSVKAISSAATQFSPTQTKVNEQLDAVLKVSPVVALLATPGLGRSMLLRHQAEKHGGRVVVLREIAEATAQADPIAFHDAFNNLLKQALIGTDFVAIDDLEYFAPIASGGNAPRGQYFNLVAKQLFETLVENPRKRLLVAGSPPNQWGQFFLNVLQERSAMVTMPTFTPDDYVAIAANILGPTMIKDVDFRQVFRHASRLQGHQLRLTCALLQNAPSLTTESFIECLNQHILTSNVSTSEVENITFDLLPGAEYIAQTLETNIILPLENRQLAQEMGLKPKRGVLLYGPPGTGKTVIGRALAHRMKGKFFMIDGSFISEPPGTFFNKVQAIVADAKANSPSVLFIDDADVLFKIEHIQGVVRFLLSLLDGLESETASNVCVMMTAMNVTLIPDALLRSGRVEVWLQTYLPNEEVRGRILRRYLGGEKHLPKAQEIDFTSLGKATEGFTQADLRRIAGDAKSFYASDVVNKRMPLSASEYVQKAVQTVIEVRARMADSLGDETLRLDKDGKSSKYFNSAAATQCGEQCGY